MFKSILARWLAVSLGLVALSASGQTPAAPSPQSAGSAPATQMQAPSGEYRSALEGYRPYTEDKMLSWKDANDMVGRIGGWRAYAKEAAEGQGQQGHVGHGAPGANETKPSPSQAKP